MRTGEATPDHSAPDSDTGPVTDVERLVASMTPLDVGRFTSAVGEIRAAPDPRDVVPGIALAPTPGAELSVRLARAGTSSSGRILGGRYRLGRQLGAGGYGAVYAAEDTITGERVAIKVLSPGASLKQELVIRFHREAIAASRVRHPHIVHVADFDVDEDDGHYIVMEQLDGCDLAQTLADEGRLAPVRALTVAAQCARGLAAAHRVGVLHRDLKPANVFVVRREGGREIVKVIDFGISKLTAIAGDYTDVTSASKVVGTPLYMAPEQARGKPLDARADVYALGVMLFEMLVGERPFGGRSPLEILGNHFSAPRIAPSNLRAELAGCPGLDALVLRALAADPDQRFPSMESFGDALLECLRAIAPDAARHATEPTGARAASSAPVTHDDATTSEVWRFVPRSRRRRVVAAMIVTIIAAVGWMSRTRAPAPAAQHADVAVSSSACEGQPLLHWMFPPRARLRMQPSGCVSFPASVKGTTGAAAAHFRSR
ncbi:MAG TPA: serine/threonine-protein kinase [Kofleriaceae bacterium]|nr:serine/threonine-protein kinase [Kofleriaceae bacterium]